MRKDSDIQVLALCTSDSSGGAARAAYRIHEGVNRQTRGVSSTMLVKDKRSDDPTVHALREFSRGGRVADVAGWIANKWENQLQHARWRPYPDRMPYYMSDLRGVPAGSALRRMNFDLLHLHWINQRFVRLRDLAGVGKPVVWTLHDSWPFCGVCHYFLDCERYKEACGRCPHLRSVNPNDLSRKVWKEKNDLYGRLNLHIVAPSRWMAAVASESGLLDGVPVTVIPNSVDTEVYRPYGERSSLAGRPVCVAFGAMNALKDSRKGYAYLRQALDKLPKDLDYRLMVFGADALPEEGLPARCLGVIRSDQEMASVYNQADVVVVPSIAENLSCTIMEALSCGTPVVAFRIGGNGDMIDHRGNGYLAEPFNSEDLAAGIVWCAENQERLSFRARQTVMERFTMAGIAERYTDLYRSLS